MRDGKSLLDGLKPDLMSAFGEDFGRSGDVAVIWPLQLGQGLMRRTPFVVELRNVPFKQQEQILEFPLVAWRGRYVPVNRVESPAATACKPERVT